jgi:hypothetical protein
MAAKKQTRRAISIAGETYDRLRKFSDKTEQPMSRIVETLIKAELEQRAGGQP